MTAPILDLPSAPAVTAPAAAASMCTVRRRRLRWGPDGVGVFFAALAVLIVKLGLVESVPW